MTDYAPASGVPVRFRLKPLPILYTVLLGILVLFLSANAAALAERLFKLPHPKELPWVEIYYAHIGQLVFSLLAIFVLKRMSGGNFGLQLPRGKSYVGAAVLWGIVFGLIMCATDFWQLILQHKPPTGDNQLTPVNIAGWLSFEGIFVGPSEEILFRSLLITFLAQRMPGSVTLGGYSLSGAGIVVAVLFALAHAGSFASQSFWNAFAQQIYAFTLGVLYAYWFEKSRSILAPIIGHNVSDVTEQLVTFAMVWAWG